jgi:hypothetical protein
VCNSGTDSRSGSESDSSSSRLDASERRLKSNTTISKRDMKTKSDKPRTPGKGMHDKRSKKDKGPDSGSGVGQKTNGRKSISESRFVQEYDDVLKPFHPTYQAMMFAAFCYTFKRGTSRRMACVDILLAASKNHHTPSVHCRFKKAVNAEIGRKGASEV